MVDRSTPALRPLTTGSPFSQAWDKALGHLDPSWEKQVRHVLSPRSPAAAAAAAVIFISSPAVRSEPLCGQVIISVVTLAWRKVELNEAAVPHREHKGP